MASLHDRVARRRPDTRTIRIPGAGERRSSRQAAMTVQAITVLPEVVSVTLMA
jgi:hypothetical protein